MGPAPCARDRMRPSPRPARPDRRGQRVRVARHPRRRRDRREEHREPALDLVELPSLGRPVEHRPDQPVREDRAERRVDRLELQLAQRLLERRHRRSAEAFGEPAPLARDAVEHLAELPEDVAAIGVELDVQAALPDLPARADGFQTRPGVPEDDERRRIVGQSEPLRERPPDQRLRAVRALARVAADSRIHPLVDAKRT